MTSRKAKKFEEWAQKIRTTLKKAKEESDAYCELPNQCKYLKYWADKLQKMDPKQYIKTEKDEMDLLGKSALELHRHYMEYLTKAEKHRFGTKARMKEILRYVYYYSKDVHPNLIEAGKEKQSLKYLKAFWKYYLDEIIGYLHGDFLDAFQIQCVLQLKKQSEEVDLEFSDEQKSKLSTLEEKILRPLRMDTVEQCSDMLNQARIHLGNDENISALVLADTALEHFLRELCMRLGCDDDTVSHYKQKPFRRWGMVEYLRFTELMGIIDSEEKARFFKFRDWRNSVKHIGLEPSIRTVETVINEIEIFIRRFTES